MVRSSTNTHPFSLQYELNHVSWIATEVNVPINLNRLPVCNMNKSIISQDVPSIDESEFEEGILRHFIATRNIAQLVNRRRRESSSMSGPSSSVAAPSSMLQIPDSPEENMTTRYGVEVGLPASVPPPSSIESDISTGKRDGHRYWPV